MDQGIGADAAGRFEREVRENLPVDTPIVCFANDWRGDPTSKHHVMRIYSQFTDVLWVESAGMRVPNIFSRADLNRIAQRVRNAASTAAAPSVDGRVHVLSPLGIPLPGNRLAETINARTYHRAVARALAPLSDKPPLVWVFQPTVVPYLRHFPRAGLVYHCVDRWWEFSEYDAATMRRYHRELCEQADVTFASAEALLEDCLAHTTRAELVPHGVEWAHFAQAALDPPGRPADIADITQPIIGFFGLIHEWVDQELLCLLARAHRDTVLVLIGACQVDVSRLEAEPNIRLLGRRPYKDLPAYAAAFDIALIPFVFTELTAAVNPIKLREYLSAGLPTVASALPAIVSMGDRPGLFTAEQPDAFLAEVRKALALSQDREGRAARARAMASESWLGRCAQMAASVRAAIARRT